MSRWLPVLLMVCAAVVLGCGKSEIDKFGDNYKPLNDRLLSLGGELGRDLRASPRRSGPQNAKVLSGRADELRALQRDLAALDAPSSLKANLDALIAALDDTAKKLSDFAARTREKKKLSIRGFQKEFGPIARRVDKAQNALAGATGARGK